MKQPDLFTTTAYGTEPAPSPAQADAKRDEALAKVQTRAEADEPGFVEKARAFIVAYLHKHGPTSSEDITDAAIAAGIVPDEMRAFGPVYRGLSRDRVIVRTGTCQRRRGHNASGGNVWGIWEPPR